MKNILFIHYGGNLIRGSEVCLLNLLSHMDKTLFNPVVICNQGKMLEELEKLGIKAWLMDIPEITIDGRHRRFQIFGYIKCFFILCRFIKKNGIHLIYSNSGLPSQLGVPLAKLFNLSCICHIHARHTRRYAWMWLFKFADKVT